MKYIVGFLAVAVLAIGGYFFPTFTPAAQPAGSVVGNEIYNFLYIARWHQAQDWQPHVRVVEENQPWE